jgi:hypothetical protein
MNIYNLKLKDGALYDGEWRSISKEARVDYQTGKKTVYLCTLPAVKIKVQCGELETEMDIPEDCQVYKANRGQAVFVVGKENNNLVSVCIGLVKEGRVIEERVLNIYENIIQGWKQ